MTIKHNTYRLSKNNFAVLSVGDILKYYLIPAALRNEFSESLYLKTVSTNNSSLYRQLKKEIS